MKIIESDAELAKVKDGAKIEVTWPMHPAPQKYVLGTSIVKGGMRLALYPNDPNLIVGWLSDVGTEKGKTRVYVVE